MVEAAVVVAIITLWVVVVSTDRDKEHEPDKRVSGATVTLTQELFDSDAKLPRRSKLAATQLQFDEARDRFRTAQTIRALVEQITELKKQVERELAQAEKDDEDARKADGIAANLVFGKNTSGKILQEAGSLMSTAKGIRAENHRRCARHLSTEIQRLSQELATTLLGRGSWSSSL